MPHLYFVVENFEHDLKYLEHTFVLFDYYYSLMLLDSYIHEHCLNSVYRLPSSDYRVYHNPSLVFDT